MMALRWSHVEAIKWCALVAMVCDHVNSIVLRYANPGLAIVGRAAFPAFAFAIAYGFVRGPGDLASKAQRIGWRLLLVGLISQPVTMYVRGDVVGNILFTFALGLSGYFVLSQWSGVRRLISMLLVVFPAMLVEYGIPGVLLVIASCYLIHQGTVESLIVWLGALCVLVLVNGNAWGFLVIPLVVGVRAVQFEVPRIRGFFYPFYPLHFLVLAAVSLAFR